MVKAVFIHKSDSIYDDTPWEKYDFPRTYLSRVEQCVGDWIVYYEPRSAFGGKGQLAYFATARIDRIIENPGVADRFYALVAPGSYLTFDRPVARMLHGEVIETKLRGPEGGLGSGGNAQSAVRLISDQEFDVILSEAFTADPEKLGLDQATETIDGFAEPPATFDRPIIQQLLNRPFRDAAFARQVKRAYANRCAISGLAIRNGGGSPEVEAAHIRPVAEGGPDTVRNGLALSGTVHWMFDRGLLSIDEDGRSILIAKDRFPDTAERLIVPDRKLLLPADVHALPHPAYLSYHRENVFKG